MEISANDVLSNGRLSGAITYNNKSVFIGLKILAALIRD